MHRAVRCNMVTILNIYIAYLKVAKRVNLESHKKKKLVTIYGDRC